MSAISCTGVQSVLASMRKMKQRDGVKIREGLMKAARTLYNKSQQLVPVDTGALKTSGKYGVEGVGFAATAYVSYDTAYAIYVHENLTAYHKPPTQARYLADAINRVRGAMTRALGRELSAGTRDATGANT